jgi:hypothetical protein
MATLSPIVIGTAQTGNVNTAAAANNARDMTDPAAIVIVSTVGATPTVTANIQGSIDGVNFYNIPYALVATPGTFVLTAITITTAVTVAYLLQPGQAWQVVRVAYTANTNVTLTTTAYL